MYTGNPHQDPRGLDRRGHKSFTSGWESGWNDFKDNRDLQGPMNPGGQLPRPNPWNGKPFPKGQETTYYPQLAELTQKQKDMMGSPYNTPDFGVSKEDLWNRTKGMEKKGFFGWGAQEPTTQQEFNDYYNQLEQGESGNWLAMNRGLDNWGAGAANTLGYDGTFRQEGFGDPNAINMWG